MSLYTIKNSQHDDGGGAIFYAATVEAPDGLAEPVLCLCGQVYDLGKVHVTAHHGDCSVWHAPCCNREADDRPGKSLPDYTPLTRITP